MEWFAAVDGYCERTGPEYWSEPLNALTNLAFVISAYVMWPRVRGIGLASAMCVVLAGIGLGSWLFHTHANQFTGLADVAPIGGFILLYLYAANRDYMGFRPVWAVVATAVGMLAVIVTAQGIGRAMPGLGANAAYIAVAALIFGYGGGIFRFASGTGRGLMIGSGILAVSITMRMLDGPLCGNWPYGTHFLWHLLNALMLGWMIEVYRRHRLAGALGQG